MVVVSLLVVSLDAYAGQSLHAVSLLRSAATKEYAADGATDLAIQTVRYSSSEYQTAALCSPGPGNVVTISSMQLIVTCSGTYNYYSPTGATRTIKFATCPASESAQNCTSGATVPNTPIVTATVVFDDWSATDVNRCSGLTTTTCGTGMIVENWVVTT